MLAAPAFASEPGIQSEVLLKTTTSWNGAPIRYPQGVAELTSVKVRLEQGAQTPFHCHPVPTFAYMLSGVLEVQAVDGAHKRFKHGESLAEVIDTWHRGQAIDGPVEIIVFYAGSRGIPTTIVPKTKDPEREACAP